MSLLRLMLMVPVAAGCLVARASGQAVRAGEPRESWQARYEDQIRLLESRVETGDTDAAHAVAVVLRTIGRYEEAETGLRRFLARHPDATSLWVSLGDALWERGRVTQAEEAYGRAVSGRAANRLVVQERLAEIKEHRGQREAARRDYAALAQAYNNGAARGAPELAAVGRAVARLASANPQLYKDALRAYDQAVARDSADLDLRVELGDLFLDRYNETEARATFEAVLRVDPTHPGALVGLARALRFEGSGESLQQVRRSLEVNPNYVPAILFLARIELEQEAYDRASDDLAKAVALNPASLEALSLQAATRLLVGDARGFEQAKARVLAINPLYADLFVTLADLLARNRRYDEALAAARQAIALDSAAWRAFALLGTNQLRRGEMRAGRNSLERAFAGDPFDVWTKNTLDLLDNLDKYVERASPRFRIVAVPREADLMALYAGPLAEEAYDSLAARYGYRPPTPIRVEMYDRHADFSVRTVGLVGLGALGVSFGSVVAMDSPSAREAGHFHWGSTLWHELAHTFHLGLSANRVPRWFTEGLAVFEERRARPGWGDGVTPGFLLAFIQDRLVPVSRLNRGFTNPDYPEQLLYSYYEASLVCDLIAQDKGLPAFRGILAALAAGKSMDDAFAAVMGTSLAAFDDRFTAYVRERFAAPLAALQPRAKRGPEAPGSAVDAVARARRSPEDFDAQLSAGRVLVSQGNLAAAEPFFERGKELFPQYAGLDSPAWYLAQIYQRRGENQRAVHELETLTAANAAHYPALLALAALLDSLGDRPGVAAALQQAVYVDPFDVAVHTRLGGLAAERGRWPAAIRERQAVLALGPTDRAEAWYQLARAYYGAGRLDEARAAVLRALEQAPSFEDAQELLLKIREGRPNGGRVSR